MNSSAILPVLIELLIKSAAILGAAALLARVFQRASAARRHLIWLGAFAALLLLPLTKLVTPRWSLALTKPQPPAAYYPTAIVGVETVAEPTVSLSFSPPPPARISLPDWRTVLIGAWIAGSGLVLGYRLLGSIRLALLGRRSKTTNNPRLGTLMQAAIAESSIKRRVRLLIATDARVPITWGIFRPVLLLPSDWSRWSDEKLAATLRHELSHITRHDYLVRLLAQIVTALYWPNPLVWLAGSSLRAAQEQACDDHVLRHGTTAGDYAELLFQTAQANASRAFETRHALAMARPSTLERRLVAIVDDERDRRPAGAFAFSAIVPLLAISLGVSAFAQLQNQTPPAEIPDLPKQPPTALIPGAGSNISPRQKAKAIILPSVDFRDASLRDCLNFLKRKSVELDPEKQGVNFAILGEPEMAEKKITLNVRNNTLSDLVQKIAGQADLRCRFDVYAINFLSKESADPLIQKEYKFPRSLIIGRVTPLKEGSGLAKYARVDVKDFLTSRGVSFPGAAAAVYISATERLVVRNTQDNLDRVDELIADLIAQNPSAHLDSRSTLAPPSPEMEKAQAAIAATQSKLARIILPRVQFKEVDLKGAIGFLATTVRDLDPDKTGVKFVVSPEAENPDIKITISLSNIPAIETLKYITNLAGTKYHFANDGNVYVSPLGTQTLITKLYGVPVKSISQGNGTVIGPDGKTYSSAQEFFSAFGVAFPEGAAAGLPVDGKTMALRNTQENLDVADLVIVALVDAKDGKLSAEELDAVKKMIRETKGGL